MTECLESKLSRIPAIAKIKSKLVYFTSMITILSCLATGGGGGGGGSTPAPSPPPEGLKAVMDITKYPDSGICNAPLRIEVKYDRSEGDPETFKVDFTDNGVYDYESNQITGTAEHIFNVGNSDHGYTVILRIEEDKNNDGEIGEGEFHEATEFVSVNTIPQINTNDPTEATIDSLYTNQIDASDADEDILTYSLIQGEPLGVTINETGLIEWIPDNENVTVGFSYTIEYKVEDGEGGIATRSYNVLVNAAVGTYTASGDVVNNPDNIGIAGAAVKLTDLFENSYNDTTDGNGNYTIIDILK